MAQDFLTTGEFERWREDFREWQHELNGQIAAGFKGVHDRLDDLNGRTRANSEDIASIRAGGCQQIKRHQASGGSGRGWKWVASISAVVVALLELLKVIAERIQFWVRGG